MSSPVERGADEFRGNPKKQKRGPLKEAPFFAKSAGEKIAFLTHCPTPLREVWRVEGRVCVFWCSEKDFWCHVHQTGFPEKRSRPGDSATEGRLPRVFYTMGEIFGRWCVVKSEQKLRTPLGVEEIP